MHIIMVAEKIKIRCSILYEFKLGRKTSDATRNIRKVFGEDAVSDRNAQFWFAKFRRGDESLDDDPRTGRPSVVSDEILRDEIESNPRQTCSELAQTLKISETTVRDHLHSIGKVRKLDKWVPHNLTYDNKRNRLFICSSLVQRLKNEPLCDRIITCDKWIPYDNVKRS